MVKDVYFIKVEDSDSELNTKNISQKHAGVSSSE